MKAQEGIAWFRALVKSDSDKGFVDVRMTIDRANEVLHDLDRQLARAEARGFQNGKWCQT
jgi:hypothetical protein